MSELTFEKLFYLPIGRVFVLKTKDNYLIETTEMRTVDKEGLYLEDIKDCWDHTIDFKDKWILDVSTQKGCAYKCLFCDVPKNQYKGNLTSQEMLEQISYILKASPYVTESKNTSIYFARMGEPSHNIDNVLDTIKKLPTIIPPSIDVTPAINTILPRRVNSKTGFEILAEIIEVKNQLSGKLDINISCTTTNLEQQTHILQGAKVYLIEEIIDFINKLTFIGNRIRLNFIILDKMNFDYSKFEKLDTNKIELRLTPLTSTSNSKLNELVNGNMKEITDNLQKLDIPYHILPTPHMKTFGLGCGQFISLNEKQKK